MPIYDRGLSASQMLRGQPTSLLGIGQPAQLPGRPEIPQVGVGGVSFQELASDQRSRDLAAQQQTIGSLVNLAALAPAAYGVYRAGQQPVPGSFAAQPGTFGSPGYAMGYSSPLFDLNYAPEGYSSPLFNLNYGGY